MGVDGFEQVLREAGELGIDLQLHAGSHERETLEQSLHVRIRALEAVQAEP
jgi:hypothetical protein